MKQISRKRIRIRRKKKKFLGEYSIISRTERLSNEVRTFKKYSTVDIIASVNSVQYNSALIL